MATNNPRFSMGYNTRFCSSSRSALGLAETVLQGDALRSLAHGQQPWLGKGRPRRSFKGGVYSLTSLAETMSTSSFKGQGGGQVV